MTSTGRCGLAPRLVTPPVLAEGSGVPDSTSTLRLAVPALNLDMRAIRPGTCNVDKLV